MSGAEDAAAAAAAQQQATEQQQQQATEQLACAEQHGAGWQWCDSLSECIHSHVQTCPAVGSDDMGFGGSSSERTALDELLSHSIAVKVSVALICLFVVNEIAKSLLLRQEQARRQVEEARLVTSASSPDTAAKAQQWDKMQEEHRKLSEAALAERREEERQAKLIEIEHRRKKYGMKDWKQAQPVGSDGTSSTEEDVRARQVAEQDEAAPAREAALRDQAERAKEAKLKAIERQRKAYGLLPKGQSLGSSSLPAAESEAGGYSGDGDDGMREPVPEPVLEPDLEQVMMLLQGLGLEQKVLTSVQQKLEVREKLVSEPVKMTPREARAATREARAQ